MSFCFLFPQCGHSTQMQQLYIHSGQRDIAINWIIESWSLYLRQLLIITTDIPLHTMHDLSLVIFSGIGILLVLLPLPLHWRARNAGTLLLIAWLFISNFIFFVDGIVWWNSYDLPPSPIWCDIGTHWIYHAWQYKDADNNLGYPSKQAFHRSPCWNFSHESLYHSSPSDDCIVYHCYDNSASETYCSCSRFIFGYRNASACYGATLHSPSTSFRHHRRLWMSACDLAWGSSSLRCYLVVSFTDDHCCWLRR